MSDELILSNIPLKQRYNAENIVGADIDSESYDRCPVSSFGLNMLYSMGWYEGRGVGKNPERALMDPVEFVPRATGQGLGASHPNYLFSKKKKIGEAFLPEKHVIKIGEKVKQRGEISQNSLVRIINGKHKGLQGRVILKDKVKKECVVELVINEQNVKIDLSEIELITQIDNNNGKKNNEESNSNGKKSSRSKSREKRKNRELKWVIPNIKVKVISSKVLKGKLYNTKVIVTDILDHSTFEVLGENGEIIDCLREKDLETCLGRIDSKIIYVRGINKGKTAILKSRDKKKNKVIVQLEDSMEFYECTQDDVAEYVMIR